MTNKNADASLGDGGASLPPPHPGAPDHLRSCGSNTIFKSGPLFLSSKGIGWTSWKKRWFILTRTSLVFFRSDPSAVPQKGNEVNLTLGGIDLNNSGSVVVKVDKKLLTVLFPDGRDGRAFTLKTETTEDLYEWKTALENALAQAPSASAANVVGQNGIFRNDQTESIDISLDQSKDREPTKSTVIGRPILLALEDADGAPSFLEKALRFIEEHGVKVEGILRQAADVDDVEHRVQEYEQGKVDFSSEEDAHVVADCVKHVLRELPSSPVPASCCKALLEACRTERASRVAAMRAAVCETFPEPNRRLLQRILLMMQAVASHKAENRMSSSAVAACMAPLLLRSLLAGECEIENDFDVGGDGSIQLLQAAAAANHAQAIVITLLEEYVRIFGEGGVSPDIYTDSEESVTESDEATDVESYDDDYDDELDESVEESDADADADADADDDLVNETCSETGNSRDIDVCSDKDHVHPSSKSSGVSKDLEVTQMLSSNSLDVLLPQHEDIRNCENIMIPSKNDCVEQSNKSAGIFEGVSTDQSKVHHSSSGTSCIRKSITISNAPAHKAQRRTVWGRTSARKNLSMESIDYPVEDESEIERLKAAEMELQNQIAEEVKGSAKQRLEKQKNALHERHLALVQDVNRLQEQLQKEKSFRATLEAGLKFSPGALSDLTSIDDKTKADLEELALVEADLTSLEQKVNYLGMRLNLQQKRNYVSALDCSNEFLQISNHETKLKNKPETVTATSQFNKSRSKDRRSQVANELHNIDKGREYGHSAQNPEKSEFLQPLPSPNKSGGSEIPSVSNPEKGRGSGSSLQMADKSSGNPGQSLQNLEKMRKSESHPAQHSERWNQHPQHLNRGKSEGHNSYNVYKGR